MLGPEVTTMERCTILPGDPVNSGSEVREWSVEDYDQRATPTGDELARDTDLEVMPAGEGAK